MPSATIPTAAREHGMRMGRTGILRLGGTISVGMGAEVEGWEAGAVDGGGEEMIEKVEETG
jgi:hypothetical protein